MPPFSDMPLELLLDNIFPFIPTPDLLNLCCTSKFFALLCSDDTLWRRKLRTDFNFSGETTARTSGWKYIYRGLSQPKAFVWGEKANGRLGLSRFPKTNSQGVPFPTQLRIPGVRLVNLVAGGMSFHALDSEGNIHVWGTLDGTTTGLNSDGYSEPGKLSNNPLRLDMPTASRSISCGRLHSSCLDHKNKIWTFVNWGRPFQLVSPLLEDPDAIPLQIECGWSFSSLLTKGGDIFVWWPFSGQMHEIIAQKNLEMDQDGDKKAIAREGLIPCVTWSLEFDPVRLPPIPPLPELPHAGDETTQITQLIQIAAFESHIIGLTNCGHVLKFGSTDNETTTAQGRWEYLPQFSEVDSVREHPTFSGDNGDRLTPPETMQITHISANFQHFIAYSTGASSVVLMGDTDTTPNTVPKIIPALQNRAVISVVLGDYHNAALTAGGKLLTWGAYSAGALGLGDPAELEPGTPGAYAIVRGGEQRRRREPPAVQIPTEVRFDHGAKKPKDRFCFAATAAGWHTGALVIDLDPDDEEDEIELEDDEPELEVRNEPNQWESPPIIPFGGVFRVGHAGRGIFGRGLRGGSLGRVSGGNATAEQN